jgi:sugar phosphate isomerase/epimerase
MAVRIGSGFAPFSGVVDRSVPGGYREAMSFEEQLHCASQVRGLDAIGLDYPMQFDDPVALSILLRRYGLAVCVLEMGIYGERRWTKGSLSSCDPLVRREAIRLVQRGMDVAAELGVAEILLWAGQDGFEYPFQADYGRVWGYLVEGIAEIASHHPDIRVGIEYKPKEPRVRCHIDTAAKTLLLCQQVNLPNVGVTVDLGHSLAAQENPGQAAALCARFGRLFQVHVNDNYGDWDSDLLVGQVNFWLTLEFFYWLNRCGFDSWYIMDFFPYREDGMAALEQCIRNTQRYAALALRLDPAALGQLQAAGDPVVTSEWLWQRLFGSSDSSSR